LQTFCESLFFRVMTGAALYRTSGSAGIATTTAASETSVNELLNRARAAKNDQDDHQCPQKSYADVSQESAHPSSSKHH
jgi:hypothetical protein